MARRGVFGRQARVVQNLTSTIVAIAREMEAKQDQNIMDAWKQGGTFEGKPATDAAVIAYWRNRLANVDPKDPLHDTYSNAVTQLEYSIAESKASTRYAQGSLSAKGMADFFLGWSKKIPKDSEFYRVLQRDAAQFMRAAHSGSNAAAAKAKEQAYQSSQNATYKSKEAAGDYITNALSSIAKGMGIIGAGPNDNITGFDPTDPAALLTKLASLTQGSTPGQDPVLFTDANGKPVLTSAFVAKLKQLDPHFSGQVTLDYFARALQNQASGQAIRLKAARDTGHATDVNRITNQQQFTNEVAREARAWPVEQSYMNARQQWLAVWLDPSAAPKAKTDAFAQYAGTLTKLANTHLLDANTSARLTAEATGNSNVENLSDNFTGLSANGPSKDTADTFAHLQVLKNEQDVVATQGGAYVWTMGNRDPKTGAFVASPTGLDIGAAPAQQVLALTPAGAVPMMVPQHDGSTIQMLVPGQAVTASVVDQNGNTVPSASNNDSALGTSYVVMANGKPTQLYAFKNNGVTYYTQDAPWKAIPGAVQHGTQVTITVNSPAVGAGTGTYFGLDPNGKLYAKVHSIVFSDPARTQSGVDPSTDSVSPTIALSLAEGASTQDIRAFMQNQTYAQQVNLDLQNAATVNGAVNPAQLGVLQQQLQTTLDFQDGSLPNNGLYQHFDKGDPRPHSTFDNAPQASPTGWQGPAANATGSQIEDWYAKTMGLPSDKAANTNFSAISDAYKPGTPQLAGPDERPGHQGMTINTGSTLKVPAMPNIDISKLLTAAAKPATVAPYTPAPTPGLGSFNPIGGGQSTSSIGGDKNYNPHQIGSQ